MNTSPSDHAIRLGRGWSQHLSSQLKGVAAVSLGYAAHKWASMITRAHTQAHTISLQKQLLPVNCSKSRDGQQFL